MNTAVPLARRCAIYTRKSSEEGLDQAFNSLDAQREAGEAFIKSQAHEGWVALPTAYDDGGFSGGNLARPALAALLAAIQQGAIDTVIVYKVDRLSRSLADFVRLVELFDKHGVSFVSVTQQFNTSTSMGRLTLNVLLSFAQFEREVTSERIRDKIAASKKKGMWMGGTIPLGYDRVDKQLVVNEPEAEQVRHLFERYLAVRCVRALKAELDAKALRSKSRPSGTKSQGAKPFSRGALYTILKNPVYIGKVPHRGALHVGQHTAIVAPETWHAVQDTLTRNRHDKTARASVKHPSLLAGLVVDDRGNRMSPTYTRRRGKHYPFYVSQAVLQYREDDAGSVVRVPGTALEDIVVGRVLELLQDGHQVLDTLAVPKSGAAQRARLMAAASAMANQWQTWTCHQRCERIQLWLRRVEVGRDRVRVVLATSQLAADLVPRGPTGSEPPETHPAAEATIDIPVQLRRSGIETKLVVSAGPPPAVHKVSVTALQEALLKALTWNEALMTGEVESIDALTRREGVDASYARHVRKLAFLAPDIIEAIIAGDVPDTLTLDTSKAGIPLGWKAQRERFRP